MSEYRIKNAAITRTGFDYQDLVGIEILIEYYRDQYKYKWVQLESEDGEFGALDDVVAALPDGTFELTQVETSEYRSVIGLGQCGWGRGAAICWP